MAVHVAHVSFMALVRDSRSIHREPGGARRRTESVLGPRGLVHPRGGTWRS
jgi:hypothetical protein